MEGELSFLDSLPFLALIDNNLLRNRRFCPIRRRFLSGCFLDILSTAPSMQWGRWDDFGPWLATRESVDFPRPRLNQLRNYLRHQPWMTSTIGSFDNQKWFIELTMWYDAFRIEVLEERKSICNIKYKKSSMKHENSITIGLLLACFVKQVLIVSLQKIARNNKW